MLSIDLSDPKVAIVKPEGALAKGDFDALQNAVDGSINEHDVIPSLVVQLDHLPHWDSFAAMGRHFEFVRMHHKIVRKVAVVGDGALVAMAPQVADLFAEAKVRHFPAAKRDAAIEWARAEDDDPGRFEPIEGLPRDVVAVRLVGIITAEDYRDMLVPLIEQKLKDHDKLKMLVVMDEDYAGYSADAAWADMRFGLGHVRDLSKIALVTDIGWVRKAAKLFAPLWPGETRMFDVAELDSAKSWVKS